MWKPRNQTQRAAFRREARVTVPVNPVVGSDVDHQAFLGTLALHWDISIYILYHFVKGRRVSCWCQISCDFNSRNWPANQRFSGGIVADWQRNMGPLEKPLGVSNRPLVNRLRFHHISPRKSGDPAVLQFWLGTRPGNFLHFANLKPWRRNSWFTQLQNGGSFQFVFLLTFTKPGTQSNKKTFFVRIGFQGFPLLCLPGVYSWIWTASSWISP
jgi:hypothetical protein